MSYYDIKITGKDVKRFLHNLHKMHIEFLNVEYVGKSVIIKVSKEDYQRIKEIKTIYEIEVVQYYGIAKVYQTIKQYALFFTMLGFGFLMLLGLTQVIFEVEVIHNDKELRELLLEELKKEGIYKYHFVVSYSKKERIKENILKKYKDKIEWLEIERQGTRYEIKVEERKQKIEEKEETPRNIIAKKNGLITKITSSQGEILARKDQYVKKGDILIGGTIHNKEEIVGYTKAVGNVYAETWYTVTVELPYHYYEERKTNNSQKILQIEWFQHQVNLFDFQKYQNSKLENIFKLKNPLLPISISIQNQEEVEITDKVYTKDNAYQEANTIGKTRLKESLGENIEIIYEKNLKIIEEDSKIKVVIFYKVLEEITDYQTITVPNEIPEEE